MARLRNQQTKLEPDQIALNPLQVKHLAAMAGVDENEISGKNIAELSQQLKWKIDPKLFLFEQICGTVVKQGPDGNDYPVPYATVNVEDTECDLLIYHPERNPWSWHFPIRCHSFVIGTTTTDACGKFCLWVPRFEIEWIETWRRERICFPIIFKRPTLVNAVVNKPDPAPGDLNMGMVISDKGINASRPLFEHDMPPPLPAEFKQALSGQNLVASKGAKATDAIQTSIAEQLGLAPNAAALKGFNPFIYRGPFFRCIEVNVPVWQIVFRAPDISFNVTQNGQTIYSGGYAGSLSNVTLVANSLATENPFCGLSNTSVQCGDEPALVLGGAMLLADPYFNATTGYAERPNAPIPTGLAGGTPDYTLVQTPFCETVALSGCVDVENAQYYQIQQSFTLDGISWSGWTPITGLSWRNMLSTPPFTSLIIVADSNGWYPVEPLDSASSPVPRTDLELPNLLMYWPTPILGTTRLQVVLGDATKTQIGSPSATVAITTDNTMPSITPQLFWKFAGDPDTTLLNLVGVPEPTIERGSTPRDIEIVAQVSVMANHFRDAGLGASGFGGGPNPIPIADPLNLPEHWYENVLDNSVTLYQRYSITGSGFPQGCYNFGCEANSRAMNPSCDDNGCLIPPDWFYNSAPIYSEWNLSVAIVNE